MSDLTRITATFAVGGGGYAEGDLDVTGLNPDKIAELVWDDVVTSPSLCHQCSHEISDPEAEYLTGFRVNGVEYVKDGDHWVVAS